MMKINKRAASDHLIRSAAWGGFDERVDMPHSAPRMKKLSLILMASLAAGLASGQTEAAKTRAMSLTDCVQEALQRNLELQIERITPQISALTLHGAYGGYDPSFSLSGQHDFRLSGGGIDPTTQFQIPGTESDSQSFRSGLAGLAPWGLGYELFGNISENTAMFGTNRSDTTRGSVGINLEQPLLKNFWIDSTRLKVAISKNRLQYSELGLRDKMMSIITAVEKAYYDLIAAKENVKVQEKALQLADQNLAENKKRVEVGTLAPLDEKQSESQVARVKADLLTAQKAVSAAHNALRGLLNARFEEAFEPTEQLAAPALQFSVLESLRKAMDQRPDLVQAKLDLEQQGFQLKYDRNQLFPQLDLVGSYGHSAGGASVTEFSDGFNEYRMGNHPFYSFGAKLTVPLSNRSARDAYKISKLQKEKSLLLVKQMEDSIVYEVDNNVTAAKTSFDSLDSRRQARLYAEAALEAEQKKLENGKSTSFVVLQLQKNLTEARSGEIQALADYNKALADLARSEGSTLERRGVNVEVK